MKDVVEHPGLQLTVAMVRAGIYKCISPLAQQPLDEALCLAVGSGRVGPSADVLDTQAAQQLLGEST